MDFGKWNRAKISFFLGVDESPEMIHKCKSKIHQKGCTFSEVFLNMDIRKELIEKKTNSTGCDHVVCFQGLDLILSTMDAIKMVLQNVSSVLKEGGYFFGMFMDSSAVWSAVQKNSDPRASAKYYTIEFGSTDFKHIGSKFTFVLDQKAPTTHYLIHLPTFIQKASEYNLRMVSLINCNEFFEDHKKTFGDLLNRALGQKPGDKPNIDNDQKSIIGLYTTFVFQKVTL
uniref:mRNA (guanine-N(7))-methyltransferase n=1 Tax=Arcella intermedia TaxID=1963864 RepID=A0A6B2LG13_9EUKA